MNFAEKSILKAIKTHNCSPRLVHENDIFLEITALSQRADFTKSLSPQFIDSDLLYAFVIHSIDSNPYFLTWLYVEKYACKKQMGIIDCDLLQTIEEALILCVNHTSDPTQDNYQTRKSCGTYIMPRSFQNGQFIRNVLSLNDKSLSQLFLTYFPKPPLSEDIISHSPGCIMEKKKESSSLTIQTLFKKHHNNFDWIEKNVILLQRQFRALQRKKEELNRLSHLFTLARQDKKKSFALSPHEKATRIIRQASLPYIPHCPPALAHRLLTASKDLILFTTVKHLTASSALKSIFNNGLYGRRNLLQFYIPFKPASLSPYDIMQGDGNVVCLGANDIDPKADHGIELTFDLALAITHNAAAFYKQVDFGYIPARTEHLTIGDSTFSFSYTMRHAFQKENTVGFTVFQNSSLDAPPIAWASEKTASLISYNFNNMHQILTLNFFRFIDQLKDEKGHPQDTIKQSFYAALEQLDDNQLHDKLIDIGKAMTRSMELNFYGAHQIAFESLLTIYNKKNNFSLPLRLFIEKLNAGELDALHEATEKIPEIFLSWRFIRYLKKEVHHPETLMALTLQTQHNPCPDWARGLTQ